MAAHKATESVYNIAPDYTRGGGSIPVTLTLQVCRLLIIFYPLIVLSFHIIYIKYKQYFKEVTGKTVLLLPMGSGDDGAHSQNEKIEVRNYIEGVSDVTYYLCIIYLVEKYSQHLCMLIGKNGTVLYTSCR